MRAVVEHAAHVDKQLRRDVLRVAQPHVNVALIGIQKPSTEGITSPQVKEEITRLQFVFSTLSQADSLLVHLGVHLDQVDRDQVPRGVQPILELDASADEGVGRLSELQATIDEIRALVDSAILLIDARAWELHAVADLGGSEQAKKYVRQESAARLEGQLSSVRLAERSLLANSVRDRVEIDVALGRIGNTRAGGGSGGGGGSGDSGGGNNNNSGGGGGSRRNRFGRSGGRGRNNNGNNNGSNTGNSNGSNNGNNNNKGSGDRGRSSSRPRGGAGTTDAAGAGGGN